MKLLFITSCFNEAGGGNVIAKRNYVALEKVLGKENTSIYTVHKSHLTLGNVFRRLTKHFVGGLDQRQVNEILEISKGCDRIWIDGSYFGALAKVLKQDNYKGSIICFFHNIERNFTKITWKNAIGSPVKILPVYNAEKDAVNFSDKIVTLTERDSTYIKKWNKTASIYILPSSLCDSFRNIPLDNAFSKGMTMLFVGSYFYANIHGITWFVEKVLPFVEAKLIIVGAGMEKLKFSQNSKLEIHGFVEDLGYYYRNCDVVVAPIFEGSGMKTKTAEALMWGKYIIGTEEAFCGFDIASDCGVKCSSFSDFIEQIQSYSVSENNKFNKASRDLFLEKYSLRKSEEIITSILTNY